MLLSDPVYLLSISSKLAKHCCTGHVSSEMPASVDCWPSLQGTQDSYKILSPVHLWIYAWPYEKQSALRCDLLNILVIFSNSLLCLFPGNVCVCCFVLLQLLFPFLLTATVLCQVLTNGGFASVHVNFCRVRFYWRVYVLCHFRTAMWWQTPSQHWVMNTQTFY